SPPGPGRAAPGRPAPPPAGSPARLRASRGPAPGSARGTRGSPLPSPPPRARTAGTPRDRDRRGSPPPCRRWPYVRLRSVRRDHGIRGHARRRPKVHPHLDRLATTTTIAKDRPNGLTRVALRLGGV